MKTASAKAKGRRLQQWLVGRLVSILGVDPADLESRPMGSCGSDVIMGTQTSWVFPYAVECKNVERINIWEAYKQAQGHASKLDLEPLVVMAKNRRRPLVVVDADHFIRLLRRP